MTWDTNQSLLIEEELNMGLSDVDCYESIKCIITFNSHHNPMR